MNIPVTNIGDRKGTEIVQVYVKKVNDKYGPLKTLKGFNRVTLEAGASEVAVIKLHAESFEFFDRESGEMMITSGDYKIFYGSSSADKDLKDVTINIQ